MILLNIKESTKEDAVLVLKEIISKKIFCEISTRAYPRFSVYGVLNEGCDGIFSCNKYDKNLDENCFDLYFKLDNITEIYYAKKMETATIYLY